MLFLVLCKRILRGIPEQSDQLDNVDFFKFRPFYFDSLRNDLRGLSLAATGAALQVKVLVQNIWYNSLPDIINPINNLHIKTLSNNVI